MPRSAFPLCSQTGILPSLNRLDKMKKLLAISALLFLAACGEEYTGLGSVDLHVTSITFSDSDPATITGTLPSGKPAEFVLAVDSAQVRGIAFQLSSQADTSGFARANNLAGFPVTISRGAAQGVATVTMLYAGLRWSPSYAIEVEGSTRRVFASAMLNNTTEQVWQTDTVRFTDPENSIVTTATGHITVRPGTYPIPWWNAPAGVPEAVIIYGWPVHGRWNPMIAVYCPSAGRVENWTQTVYQRNDTLWFPADSLIELDLTWQQFPRKYHCFMEAVSRTDQEMRWRIVWPETLPRGANVEPGIESFNLSSGESVTILYKELY